MLTVEEFTEYIHLRKLGMPGVLWAEGGKLYFAESPAGHGYYEREDALYVRASWFIVYMERWSAGFWARRKSA